MEIWKDIPGFEGRYQVSNHGRVLSLPFKQRYLLRNGVEAFRTTKARVLSQQKINSGYAIVHLHLDGARKALTVHRLVAHAFVTGHNGDMVVNHIDGNKDNNAHTNLEYVTYTENHAHAVENGLNTQAIRVKCPKTGQVFPSIARAAKVRKGRASTAAKWVRV